MKKYILKRIIITIPLLIAISFISFLLINLNPSDPAEVALRVNEIVPTEEAINSMRIELGLNKPFFERYISWLIKIFTLDFGTSYINNQEVSKEIFRALPATLYLAGVSLLIIVFISVSAGIFCAIFENTWGDKLVRAIIFLGTAMPSFWVALLLIWFLSVKLDMFPTSGMEEISSVILPSITLSLAYIPTYTRLIRNSMIENKNENYVVYAKARGLKRKSILKHIFKNSIQSSVVALGMSIPKLMAGTVIVENIFSWPGMGRLCVTAIFNRDHPVIQIYVLIMASLFVFFNLITDIIVAVLDPRIRGAR